MQAVYDHIVNVLTTKFEVDAERIRPEVSLIDLELDSLAVVELYVTLQEDFAVHLDEEEGPAALPLKDFAKDVDDQISAAGASPAAGDPK
ncbi:phosphopantetheine-binding protein [Streptomyces sp. NPDC048484]|uniref:acyl carrier protein n=1 Tax=Streptomyces sp. NPDC048484 TaxID=3155146 RepID=UPI003438D296